MRRTSLLGDGGWGHDAVQGLTALGKWVDYHQLDFLCYHPMLPMAELPDFAAPDFDYDAALGACARGDRDALRRLYEREAPRLLGVALRIVRDRALAEDVLHDAFVNIWSRASSFDAGRGEGRGWIFSVVRNAALNRVRAGERTVTLEDDAAAAVDDAAALAWQRTLAFFTEHLQ